MSSTDRRAAARRKAWGRGPMILRFQPDGEGDGLSVTDPAAQRATETSVDQTVAAIPGMIGLRLLTEDLPIAESTSLASTPQSDSGTEVRPQPQRVRRVIAHKAHTQAPVHHLRVYEPADSRAARRPRTPVTPS